MMTVEQNIEEYLNKSRRLAAAAAANPSRRFELEQLVTEYSEMTDENKDLEFLFKGEQAFINGNIEAALKNYLQAGSVPGFTFFCYRASAYVSKAKGHIDKALNFAKKALNTHPDDYMTLTLYEKALTLAMRREEAQEVRTKIKTYEVNAERELTVDEGEEAYPDDPFVIKVEENQILCDNGNNESSKTASSPDDLPDSHTSKTSFKNLFTNLDRPLPELINEEKSGNEQKDEQLRSLSSELGVEDDATQALEQRIRSFQKSQSRFIEEYQEEAKNRSAIPDHVLYVLHGWNLSSGMTNGKSRRSLLSDQSRKSAGGYYLRWGGHGIALNPGDGFLDAFHDKGLHIRDIDYVVVTSDNPDDYQEVKEIYDLNYQLNKASPELQVIRYFLSGRAHQDLSRTLKPSYKQERNTIYPLEMFVDSPEVEKVELNEIISLHYFIVNSHDPLAYPSGLTEEGGEREALNLGIRLELKNVGQTRGTLRIGYVSGAPWSPLLSHHLGVCDILITGFGNTGTNDFHRLHYNQENLGYYGSLSLLEEVLPKILLSGEFGGREGDIRLETVHKMRNDYARIQKSGRSVPVVLPSDKGLCIDLHGMTIRCSVSGAAVEPSQVKVVKTAEAFGPLHYLSPSCCY